MNSDPHEEDAEPIAYRFEAIDAAIISLSRALGVRWDRQSAGDGHDDTSHADGTSPFIRAAQVAGITLRKTNYQSARECMAVVSQGYPVVLAAAGKGLCVLETTEGSKVHASFIDEQIDRRTIGVGEINSFVGTGQTVEMLIAEQDLSCESMSASSLSDSNHEHPEPVQRLIALLNLDAKDIGWVVLFAGVAGGLGLATPLVVESLVNVVSWGTYFQPLLVLAAMLFTCLGLAGVLKVLQTCVVEVIQRRQFVRIVGDLAHRFARANQASLGAVYPRELANRVFDIMTIQKATAILLLDGVSIVLTTLLGMVLLAFYHPFLLGFDIVLVSSMIVITWVLGRGGIRTAIKESKTKYSVVYWMQDVISYPSIFKIGGGEQLAIRRADELTSEYIAARRRQFTVVIRQVIFAVSLQAIASTILLGLGGWLVIHKQLTIGQLVASELVVTVVVGAFAKAGKSLEKFYDMMAALDKVGHLLDIPAELPGSISQLPDSPFPVRWSDLVYHAHTGTIEIPARKIRSGSRVAIVGNDHEAQSFLAKSIVGLVDPSGGHVSVAGFDACELATEASGRWVGYSGNPDVFHGSLKENVDLARAGIDRNDVRDAASVSGLEACIWSFPEGWNTQLLSNGYPLTIDEQYRLAIARAIAAKPRLLVIDGTLDRLDENSRRQIMDKLIKAADRWTLVIVTSCEDVASRCDEQIVLSDTHDEAEQYERT